MAHYSVEVRTMSYEPAYLVAVTDSLAIALEIAIKDAQDTDPDRFLAVITALPLNEVIAADTERHVLTADEAYDMLHSLSTETQGATK